MDINSNSSFMKINLLYQDYDRNYTIDNVKKMDKYLQTEGTDVDILNDSIIL